MKQCGNTFEGERCVLPSGHEEDFINHKDANDREWPSHQPFRSDEEYRK